ncbi:carbohydrate ABC transporter permease [Paenibacillus sp. M1]|uniref:Carbohydrate ABC transporter permease n=1 Tax=Paenibacillus haidiansis TaxID=1574488 RepID=A0ABU7VRC8_9BACL
MTNKATLWKNAASHIVLTITSIALVFPFVWMLSGAFKDSLEVVQMPPKWIPSQFNFDNFLEIEKYFPIFHSLWNSVAVAVISTGLQLLFCAMSAFVFAKINFKGREALFFLFLITLMIPMQVTMTPLFIIFQKLHLVNTMAGLILPGIFSAYGTFLLRQHMIGIPNALMEAAFIDGAGYFQIFRKLILPLSKPVLATLLIFSFMSSWNNFLWPLIITSDSNLMTLPLGLSKLQGRWATEWNILMAGNVVSFIPIFIVYLFAQKHFIKGITMSGIK